MSQLGTGLIQNADEEILITLMYSKSSQKILFVEAGKDFVDLIVGFLTLPIGGAIKLLFESERFFLDSTAISTESCNLDALVTPKTVGAIANVFKSIQRLEAEEALCNNNNNKMLTDRKPEYALGCLATESEIGLSREGNNTEPNCTSQGYYTCDASSHCSFVSTRYGAKCPRHQKKMTTQCTMMDNNVITLNMDKRDGYVKSSSKYFVTDTLEIFPSSQSLVLLQKLNVENMSSLDSIDLQVDTDEMLKLLRASLTSGNVLNDVFGKSIRDAYVVTAPHQEVISHLSSSNYEPRKPINSLQKRGPVLEDSPVRDSMKIAHDWGRGLYSALREIQDTALFNSLVKYVQEREQRISSALRDLRFSAPSERSHSSSRCSSNGTRTRHNYNKIRANGSDFMPRPCKEMLMLEKQVDKVMARLCHLISLGPSLDPPIGATKPRPPAVKPPWTTYEPSSRIRFPFRG